MSYIIHCFRWYKYFDHQLAPIYLGYYVCVLFSFLLLQKQLVPEQKENNVSILLNGCQCTVPKIFTWDQIFFISFTLLKVYLVLLSYEISNRNKYNFSIYFLVFISSVIFKINKWKYILFCLFFKLIFSAIFRLYICNQIYCFYFMITMVQ